MCIPREGTKLMEHFSYLDICTFIVFILVVVGFSIYKSRQESTSEDYFLAGRSLKWWLIGFSIVAANLSTEQFVGMAGQGAGNVGLAVSSWQLTGSIGIVVVAFFFLPRFLRAGIYTMPEYLEYRYNPAARGIMAFFTMVIYVAVTITAVLYSGGLTLQAIFGMDMTLAVWVIGAMAALYTTWGGLKAVAWADLFQGSALMAGGLLTMALGFAAVGGFSSFFAHNADKLHVILPSDHPELPWTALVVGMWIPIFYYCGLNQFIVQRTLAAKTLKQGQLGIVFAAFLWLLVPFAIVFPGIMAYQLYGGSLDSADQAYPMLIRNLIPGGLRGFMFAAICGAVMSSLASMLNSAATIFTIDLYQRHLRTEASQSELVRIGRTMTVLFVIAGCLIAPHLADPRFRGVFNYIQEFQGYISPGILAAFVFGFVVKKAPPLSGVVALLASAPIYGFLHWKLAHVAYLNRMAITFAAVLLLMALITAVKPLSQPREMPVREDFDTRPDPLVVGLGIAVILLVLVFFIVFR